MLSTNITLLRGGTQNFSLVFESQIPNPTSSQRYDYNRIKYCCAKQHSLWVRHDSKERFSQFDQLMSCVPRYHCHYQSRILSFGNRDPTWRINMTSVWLCRENIFGHFISRLVQVTSYPFFKTSESCAIPCPSLLCSTLFFLVAFRSGDFKFRESCLTITKLLRDSYVNRNTDESKREQKANIVAYLSCMKQPTRSVVNSYL